MKEIPTTKIAKMLVGTRDNVASYVALDVSLIKSAVLDMVYPIGSVYMSFVDVDPSIQFGGFWEELEPGRVLLAQGQQYPVGSLGGAEQHTLTIDELPSHEHSGVTSASGAHTHERGSIDIYGTFTAHGVNRGCSAATSGAFYNDCASNNSGAHAGGSNATIGINGNGLIGTTSGAGSHTHNVTIDAVGGGAAYSIMQPYQAVYMWRRIG